MYGLVRGVCEAFVQFIDHLWSDDTQTIPLLDSYRMGEVKILNQINFSSMEVGSPKLFAIWQMDKQASNIFNKNETEKQLKDGPCHFENGKICVQSKAKNLPKQFFQTWVICNHFELHSVQGHIEWKSPAARSWFATYFVSHLCRMQQDPKYKYKYKST